MAKPQHTRDSRDYEGKRRGKGSYTPITPSLRVCGGLMLFLQPIYHSLRVVGGVLCFTFIYSFKVRGILHL